ncbi:hypothetical protein PGTUg99_001859 [Puccinia graminis f. sp. tritici]|uniref:Uncharacterized protein n=1 Tax=Puccinia graminis f. sp. tritici TaxID=56615 RepID=A0A5B0QE22_PUCGR|nr:hypothetical protein PGTUg99_001859 [Puccinia graminis f. sp. tritici]
MRKLPPSKSPATRSRISKPLSLNHLKPRFLMPTRRLSWKDFENIVVIGGKRNYQQILVVPLGLVLVVKVITKAAAYENVCSITSTTVAVNNSTLTGRQLRQRLDAYKKRFVAAKRWSENTGAGIDVGEGLTTIEEILESKCPCYNRMDEILARSQTSPRWLNMNRKEQATFTTTMILRIHTHQRSHTLVQHTPGQMRCNRPDRRLRSFFRLGTNTQPEQHETDGLWQSSGTPSGLNHFTAPKPNRSLHQSVLAKRGLSQLNL